MENLFSNFEGIYIFFITGIKTSGNSLEITSIRSRRRRKDNREREREKSKIKYTFVVYFSNKENKVIITI